MQVTLELPDNIQTLPTEQKIEKLLQALQVTQSIKEEVVASHTGKLSKWATIAQRIEDDAVHLAGYSKQLKKDMTEFRGNFEFEHDQ